MATKAAQINKKTKRTQSGLPCRKSRNGGRVVERGGVGSGGYRPTFQTSAAFQGLTQQIGKRKHRAQIRAPGTKRPRPGSSSFLFLFLPLWRVCRRLRPFLPATPHPAPPAIPHPTSDIHTEHSSYGDSPPDTPSFCLCLRLHLRKFFRLSSFFCIFGFGVWIWVRVWVWVWVWVCVGVWAVGLRFGLLSAVAVSRPSY